MMIKKILNDKKQKFIKDVMFNYKTFSLIYETKTVQNSNFKYIHRVPKEKRE